MKRKGDGGGKFGARNESGSIYRRVVLAMQSICKGVEAKKTGDAPGRLLDGAEADFGRVAERDAGGGRTPVVEDVTEAEERFIGKTREIEAETAEIVGQESGAADFGGDGLADGVSKRKPEGERRKLVEVGDEAPPMGKRDWISSRC